MQNELLSNSCMDDHRIIAAECVRGKAPARPRRSGRHRDQRNWLM